jgi:hypothetical protein
MRSTGPWRGQRSAGNDGFRGDTGRAAAVCFFGTVPQAPGARVYCDALSIISFLALAIGGGGLALVRRFCRNAAGGPFRGPRWRGARVRRAIPVQGPQCLGNPLDVADPGHARDLVQQIIEARPMFAQEAAAGPLLPMRWGQAWWRWAFPSMESCVGGCSHGLMFAIAAGARSGPDAVPVRFYAFGSLLAIIPCALWASDAYAGRTGGGPGAGLRISAARAFQSRRSGPCR